MSDLISRQAAIEAVHCRVEIKDKVEAMAMTSVIAEIVRNIAELPSAEPRWIPVSERLPNEYGQYLCYCKDNWVEVIWMGYYEAFTKVQIVEYGILAWMPLPEPYKGGAKMEVEHE